MASFSNFRPGQKNTKKLAALLVGLYLVTTLVIPIFPAKPANAQFGFVFDAANYIWEKSTEFITSALQKAGSIAYQRTLSTALNKIAYDTANYIGSGGAGQKPLFVTQNFGAYMAQIGDEAAGTFIESFVNNLNNPANEDCSTQLSSCRSKCQSNSVPNPDGEADTSSMNCTLACNDQLTACTSRNANATAAAMRTTPSFNVCSPSSLEAKIRIGLGLMDVNRPQAPNCTASQMIKNWKTDINQKLQDLRDPNYLDIFSGLFDPQANDLGIYVLAKTDMSSKALIDTENAKTGYITNGGWLNVTNIAGDTAAPPGTAERTLQQAQAVSTNNFGKITGDVFVDASNVFLNQLALSAFNTLLRNLSKNNGNGSSFSALSGFQSDPNSGGGASLLKEVTTKLLKPNFSVRADYDVLSSLAICPNPQNPGPDNCVIDDQFMQGITEKKTVAEAMNEGYLHSDWQFRADGNGDSFGHFYSLRNILILQKYRIVPIGWEKAARLVSDSAAPHKATLGDLVSCFSDKDEYNTFSTDFGADHSWCEGLVDPNWVLKAPLNSCQKEGVGGQITNKTVIDGAGSASSTLSITRADDYCADNQTCIQEKKDGTCDAYGYCTEEKRTWDFGSNSCQPINNTCQSFTNPYNGKAVSYLENTLDYSNCTPETAGCRQYSLSGDFDPATSQVSWTGAQNQKSYFNSSLLNCTSADEGCTGLLRVKPTWGANLVMDSDLGNDKIGDVSSGNRLNDWPVFGQISVTNRDGKKSLTCLHPGVCGIYSDADDSLLPDNFEVLSGQAYTVSADVYIDEGSVTLSVGDDGAYTQSTKVLDSWQHLSVTRPAGTSYNEPVFRLTGSTYSIRNVKFEMSSWDTGYNVYGLSKFYEKILPSYLEKACYVNPTGAVKDYNLKAGAPAICGSFARKCNKEEAGCERFTASDGFSAVAKVSEEDYCPADCVGYDVYVAKATQFNAAVAENLIPQKASACSAAAAGCNEFTNLDSVGQGGEQKEYYTSLKQCIKPDSASCANFYSWEGTENGYQLKSYSLKKLGETPAVVADDSAYCNEAIFNKPVSDPQHNPDCQQFYSASGAVTYHLLSSTITCSDNCHAYRLSEKNPGTACLNGGTWNAAAGACIYMAIPGEGQSCSAQENGCREYNGNNGSNVRFIKEFDFENGQGGWSGNGAQITNIANDKDGHSLSTGGSIKLPASDFAEEGSSYSIRFLARAFSDTSLNINFSSPSTGKTSSFTAVKVKGGSNWNIYQANLPQLDHKIGADEVLTISGNLYIDDIVLSEITDRYYLIKGSSQIPADCYYDNQANYHGPDFNLGCQQYTDRGNLKHNLHQFSQLCSDSAVGCEQMIDTGNSASYRSQYWENGVATTSCDSSSDPACVEANGDRAIYAVYDSGKLCSSGNKGCSRLGQGQGGANFTGWSDVYKKNDPDLYDKTLCGSASVGCEKWGRSDGGDFSYFKDPGAAACVYRASAGAPGKKWFRIPVKRCDADASGSISIAEGTGRVCGSDADCAGKKCIIDNNDYDCPVSYTKTIGSGGEGNQVPVPSGNVGLCDAAESGCSEYIDPVTKFSPNLVNNSDYETVCDSKGQNCSVEGWGSAGSGLWNGRNLANNEQIIHLDPFKLYSVTLNGSASGMKLDFLNDIRTLNGDNNFGPAVRSLTISGPITFFSLNNKSALATGPHFSVKELAVDYQLASEVSTECNSQTKYDNGCILFNERSVAGASGLVALSYDANQTEDGKTPLTCSTTGNCNSNKLLKVRPDRVCSKWLDCISYIQDPKTKKKSCYAYASCDRLDNKGECANILPSDTSGTVVSAKTDLNYSGYALDSKYRLTDMFLAGQTIEIDDLSFDSGGFSCQNTDGSDGVITINNPDEATKPEGTDYPADGTGYLKVPNGKHCVLTKPTSVTSGSNDKFYLNYLVNTKKAAGAEGLMVITGGQVSPINLTSKSDNGWTRVVQEFTLGSGQKTITLTASTTNSMGGGQVYFDDVHIVPVLKISADTFAAPECRLYPSSDSLTCTNKNKNIVSDGLEGYCLEHDPYNKDVCLIWYPMDNIPLPSHSTLGYSGNFPLNYCTETSGSFDIVERRTGFHQKYINSDDVKIHLRTGGVVSFEGSGPYGCFLYDADDCPADYNLLLSVKECSGISCDDHLNFMCVPKPERLLPVLTSDVTYTDSVNGGTWENCQNATFKAGYAIFNGFVKDQDGQDIELKSQTPPLRIYDYDNPPSSPSELKYIPGSGIPDGNGKYFHFNCLNFIQSVDSTGKNMAWVGRVRSESTFLLNTDYSGSNPNIFASAQRQSLESAPFGSASLNGLDINAGDYIYSLKDIQAYRVPFAGLPYHCTGKNCALIGTCSSGSNADPTYFCLATSTEASLNTMTCGSYGQCQPLFNSTKPLAKDTLKNIFLSSQKSLRFDPNVRAYVTDDTGNYNFSSSIQLCTGARASNDFCAIQPVLSNVKLYFEDGKSPIGSITPFNINQKGLYRLEFNSQVDSQQQPLKSIEINWGDGFSQTITDADNQPNVGTPHVIYHYYSQTGTMNLDVKITDNWGKWCKLINPQGNCLH